MIWLLCYRSKDNDNYYTVLGCYGTNEAAALAFYETTYSSDHKHRFFVQEREIR
jgi:hypothetical protein